MTDRPVQFDTVAILGVGLIGGSLGQALKARRLSRHVIGIGRSREGLDQAIALGAIDQGVTDLAEGIVEADLVILCTTVSHILKTLPDVLRDAAPHAIVTDVGSTKGEIVRRAAGHPRFIGSHPMAGSERTGVEAAMPLLFQDATWALTPAETTDPTVLVRVRALVQDVGARTLIITPEAHDAMVAITSHLPHVLSATLMRQAAEARLPHPEIVRLSAGSFADMTRVAAADPAIWRDVCLSNRDAILDALRHCRAQLDDLEAAVADADADALTSFFQGSMTAKRDWSSL
jgi:prephenate dehydrogenase